MNPLQATPSVLAAFLAIAAPLLAEETGFITGSVLDQQGTPVPDASLSIIPEGPRVPQRMLPQPSASTKEDGRFRIGPIPAGHYAVFLFGSRATPDSWAAPVRDVWVNPKSKASITLRLKPVARAKLSVETIEGLARMNESLYWVESDAYPLVGSLAVQSASTMFSLDHLELRCPPGTLRLSPDPAFHPQSEILELTVSETGAISGPDPLPNLGKAIPVDFAVTRSDGEPVKDIHVFGVPDFTRHLPTGIYVPQGGGGQRFAGFCCVADRKLPNRYWFVRGIATQAVVTAKGCQPSITPLFVPRQGLDPLPVALEPAELVDVALTLEGLPPTVEDPQIKLGSLMSFFKGPDDHWIRHLPGTIDELDPPNRFKLVGIPKGTPIRLIFAKGFSEGTKRVHYQGRLDFTAGDSPREIIKILPR